jgi:hypothetical protein
MSVAELTNQIRLLLVAGQDPTVCMYHEPLSPTQDSYAVYSPWF